MAKLFKTEFLPYGRIQPAFFLQKPTVIEAAVYVCISMHQGNNYDAYPSYDTIAKETGYHRRNVIIAAEKLVKKGWLRKRKTKSSNRYQVVFLSREPQECSEFETNENDEVVIRRSPASDQTITSDSDQTITQKDQLKEQRKDHTPPEKNTEPKKTPDEIKPDKPKNPTLHNFVSQKEDTDILEESLPTPRRNKAPDEIPFAVKERECIDKIKDLFSIRTIRPQDIYTMLQIAKKAEHDTRLIEKKTNHFKSWVNSKKNGTATISGLLTNFDWLEPKKPAQQAVKRATSKRKVITIL